MSKIREELISILKDKHGDKASVADIIDTLEAAGALDCSLMRRAVVYERFYDSLANTSQSAYTIAWDLSFRYDVSRSTVKYITRSKG